MTPGSGRSFQRTRISSVQVLASHTPASAEQPSEDTSPWTGCAEVEAPADTPREAAAGLESGPLLSRL